LTDDEPEAEAVPEWLSQAAPMDEKSETEAAEDAVPNWFSAVENEVEPEAAAQADEDGGLEWMSAADDAPKMAEPTASSTPDWMSELTDDEPEVESASGDVPEWLSQAAPMDEESETEAAEDAVPNWFSAVENEAEPEAAAQADEDGGLEWMSAADDAPKMAEPIGSGTPDWMSELTDDEPEIEPEAVSADVPDWMNELKVDEPEIESEAVSADVPDWMAQLQDDEPEIEPEPIASSTPDWMSELTDDAPTAQSTPIDETPDWAAQFDDAEPKSEPGSVDDVPDWLAQLNADSDTAAKASEVQAQSEVDTSMPDWLMQAKSDSETDPVSDTESIMQPAAMDESEWVDSENVEAESEPLAAESVPDWLSEAAPAGDEFELESEPIAQPVGNSGFDWMTDLQAEEPAAEIEPEIEVAAPDNMPDWLSEAAPAEDEFEPEFEAEVVSGDVPDWLSQSAPQTEQVGATEPAQAETLPDWLNGIKSNQFETPDESAEAEPVSSGFSWIDDINAGPKQEDEPNIAEPVAANQIDLEEDVSDLFESQADITAPATNAPDWLNAMVPGLDVDYDAPEDEPIEKEFAQPEPTASAKKRRDFDWLVDIVEEETGQMAAITDSPSRRRFIFSRQPAWLRPPKEERDAPTIKRLSSDSASTDDDDPDIDLPPWLQ
jgi:hypothetical protein